MLTPAEDVSGTMQDIELLVLCLRDYRIADAFA
jgi:hypothetical protein